MQLRAGGGEHAEHGGGRLGVLALEDTQQRLALRERGALIDDVHALSAALVDGARPAEHAGSTQSIEARRSVEALLDVEHGEPAAMPVCWQRVELTGAAVGAIAVAELAAFDLPRGHACKPFISGYVSKGSLRPLKRRGDGGQGWSAA